LLGKSEIMEKLNVALVAEAGGDEGKDFAEEAERIRNKYFVKR